MLRLSMKFIYTKANLSTGVRITYQKDRNLTQIDFVGKGCYGRSEFDIDDKFMEAYYKAVEEKLGRPININNKYVPPVYHGKGHAQNLNDLNALVIHKMHKGNSHLEIFDNPQSETVKALLKHFVRDNAENIEFPSEEDRTQIESLFNINTTSSKERDDKNALRGIINSNIQNYQNNCKNKFIFFQRSPERDLQIDHLQQELKKIIDNNTARLSNKDIKNITKQVLKTRDAVILSHEQGSLFGSWGITESRLAASLTKIIDELSTNNFISKTDLTEIEEEINQENKSVFNI